MKGKKPRKAQRLYSSLCFSAEHFCVIGRIFLLHEDSNNHREHLPKPDPDFYQSYLPKELIQKALRYFFTIRQ